MNRKEEIRNEIKKNPNDHKAWIALGKIYFENGVYRRAFKIFDKALNICDDSYEEIVEYVVYLIFSERFTEAQRQLDYVYTIIKDEDIYLHDLQGKIYSEMGEYAKAVECFRKITNIPQETNRLNIYYGGFYFAIAKNLYKLGYLDEAIKECRNALAYEPENDKFKIMLSDLLRNQKEL